jgi:hypothetical protein
LHLLVSLSSPYIHDAQSQEPNICDDYVWLITNKEYARFGVLAVVLIKLLGCYGTLTDYRHFRAQHQSSFLWLLYSLSCCRSCCISRTVCGVRKQKCFEQNRRISHSILICLWLNLCIKYTKLPEVWWLLAVAIDDEVATVLHLPHLQFYYYKTFKYACIHFQSWRLCTVSSC